MELEGIDAKRAKHTKTLPVVLVRTTEIYTQLAHTMRGEITSPLDDLGL